MAASSPKPTSYTLSQASRKDSIPWGTPPKVLELMLTNQAGKGDLPESISRDKGMGLNKSQAHCWSWGWSEIWAVPQKKVWMLLLNENGSWAIQLMSTTCPLYPNPSVKMNAVLHPPAHWVNVCLSHDFFLPCGQTSSYMLSLFLRSILSTRDLILQSTWAPPHILSCLAKCHCTPRKHSFTLAPTPSWCGAESLKCKPAGHQPWMCFSKSLPAKLVSWLWHTLGPGDTGLTGEVITFYPSLIPLSVTWMITDKCSDGRTHSCSIYLFSLAPLAPPSKARVGDKPIPVIWCQLPHAALVKCQAALSLPVPQSCQLLQELRHQCLSDDLHTKGDCLYGTCPPACPAPVLWPGPLCRMSLWWVPKPIALVRWAQEGREKQGGIKSHRL